MALEDGTILEGIDFGYTTEVKKNNKNYLCEFDPNNYSGVSNGIHECQKIRFWELPSDFVLVLSPDFLVQSIDDVSNILGSQRSLSKLLNVSEMRISDWKGGRRKIPLGKLLTIIDILNKNGNNIKLEDVESKVIGISVKKGDILRIKFPLGITEEIGILLGLIITDGHIDKNLTRVCFSNKEIFLIDRFEELMKSVFGVPEKLINRQLNKSLVTISRINSKTLGAIFNKFFEMPSGNKSSIVVIPEIILNSPDDVIHGLIRGLISGDGWVSLRPHRKRSFSVGFKSSSKVLCKQLQGLLEERFGIKSNLWKNGIGIGKIAEISKFMKIGIESRIKEGKLQENFSRWNNVT